MTVGELVGQLGAECGASPLTQTANLLRDLGIWDAEVLEGTADRTQGRIKFVGHPLEDLDLRSGQRVRVIVFKEEENG